MSRMTLLLAAILIAAAGWSAHWFWRARAVRADYVAAAESLERAGWRVEWSALAIQGFPNRLDATFSEPALAAPSGAVAWQGSFAQIVRMALERNAAIIVLPDRQELAIHGQRWTISAPEGLKASVEWHIDPERGTWLIDRVIVSAKDITLMPPGNAGGVPVGNLLLALERRAPEIRHYRFALRAQGVGGVPAAPLDATIDGELRTSAPLALDAAYLGAIALRAIDVDGALTGRDGVSAAIEGNLTGGDGGAVDGRIRLFAAGQANLADLLPPVAADPVGEAQELVLTFAEGPPRLELMSATSAD